MLVGAVEGPGAFAFGAKIPNVHVAGKTGTAENVPGSAPHGWFIGFAPAESPTVVVAVIVENTPEGGVTAAPLGAAVMGALAELTSTPTAVGIGGILVAGMAIVVAIVSPPVRQLE